MNPAELIRAYEARDRIFGRMPEPQWRIILDLAENGPCRITSVCIGANCPQTTGLRHIAKLESDGLVWRMGELYDRKAVVVSLTTMAWNMLAQMDVPVKAAA